MTIKVIKNKGDYKAACERIYELIHANEDPLVPGSEDADEMELLSILVENYERVNYPVEAPDPLEAIRFSMEQMNLKQKDIAPLFGGKTRVSEVLNRRRSLSIKMIILLNRYLGIPLESLVVGNQSVKLKPFEIEEILGVPSIRDYMKTQPGRQTTV